MTGGLPRVTEVDRSAHEKTPGEAGGYRSAGSYLPLVVIRGAAKELFPRAFLIWRGCFGRAVEATLVEVDEPDLAGGADDEVAEVGIAEAHAKLEQALP